MRNIWALTVVSLLAVVSCKQPQALVYQDVQHVNFKGFGQSGISLDVLLYNPNKYRLKLCKADIDIYVNNSFVGKMFVVKGNYSIPAMGSFSVPLKVDVDLNNVIPNAVRLLFNHTADLKVTGKIKAGRRGISINMPVNYEGKQEIRL